MHMWLLTLTSLLPLSSSFDRDLFCSFVKGSAHLWNCISQWLPNWQLVCVRNPFPVLNGAYHSGEMLLHFYTYQLAVSYIPVSCCTGGPFHPFIVEMKWHFPRTVSVAHAGEGSIQIWIWPTGWFL